MTTRPKKGVEIELVWQRPLRSGRWFFLNRYFAFFGNVVGLVVNFVHLPQAVRFIFLLAPPKNLSHHDYFVEVCLNSSWPYSIQTQTLLQL